MGKNKNYLHSFCSASIKIFKRAFEIDIQICSRFERLGPSSLSTGTSASEAASAESAEACEAVIVVKIVHAEARINKTWEPNKNSLHAATASAKRIAAAAPAASHSAAAAEEHSEDFILIAAESVAEAATAASFFETFLAKLVICAFLLLVGKTLVGGVYVFEFSIGAGFLVFIYFLKIWFW